MTRARWLKRGAIALGALVGLRLLLAVGAHPVAGMVAADRGLELRWDSHALSLLDGSFEARALACGGDSTPPFLVVERIHVDVDLRALMSGRLVVEQLEVDGLRLAAGLDVEGRLRLGGGYDPARLAVAQTGDQAGAAPGQSTSPRPFLLPAVLPVELQQASVRHAKLEWRDEGAGGESETIEFELEAERLLALGDEGRAMLRASAPRLLDALRVELRTRVAQDENEPRAGRTSLELDAQLAGLRTARLATHLRRLGVVARGERIDGACAATLALDGSVEARDGVLGQRTQVDFALRQATLSNDGVEALGLASAALRVDHRPGRIQIDLARLAAPRARIVLEQDGIPSLAGLGFDASRAQGVAADPPSTAPRRAVGGLALDAAGFELAAGRVELVDERTSPSLIHALEDGVLRLAVLPSDAPGAFAANLVASARMPGTAQALEARAEASFGQAATLALQATAAQVDLARFADLLAPLGLAPASRPADLTIKASLSARRSGDDWTVDGRIEDLSARDGVHALAAGAVALDGLSVGDSGVVVQSLAWRGVEVDVRRSSDGALHLPLVSWTGVPEGQGGTGGSPPATGTTNATSTTNSGAAAFTAPFPSLRLGKLELWARRLRFVDEAVQPATTLELADADFVLEDLRAGGEGAQGARWSAAARAPSLWDSASAAGTLELSPDWRLRLDARVRATGVRLGHCQAYLTPFGVQALAGATDLGASLASDAHFDGGTMRLSSKLSDATWTTDGVEWAACRGLRVDGLVVGPSGLAIEALEVEATRLALRRDAHGGFQALGLRFDPRAAQPAAPVGAPPASSTAKDPVAGLVAALSAPPTIPTLPALLLKRADLRQLTLALHDDDPARPFAGLLVVSGELQDLGTRAPAAPLARLEWALPPLCAKGSIEANARIEVDRHEVTSAKFQVDGLDLQALAPWLPPGLAGEARALSARGELAASVAWQPELSARLLVSEFEVVDRSVPDAPRTLARFDRARASLGEWSRGRLVFEALELAGAELELERDAQGGVHALGLVVATSGGKASGEEASGVEEPGALRSAPLPSSASWRWRLDGLPQLELRHLDLAVRRLAWRDALLGGEPLELRLEVIQSEPWIALAQKDGVATPWVVEARGSLRPLVGDWHARLRLAAMQLSPALSASFKARDFDPAGLARIAPRFEGIVDLSPLAQAEFETGFEAKLSFPRRDERDFDWSNGVAAEFDVLPTALRSAPVDAGGRALLGVDGVEVDVKRWSPRTGDLHIPRLVVRTPRALVVRDGSRLQVAGAWLDLARFAVRPDPAPERELDSTTDSAAGRGPGRATLPAPASALGADPASTPLELATAPAPELRIDELSVDGLDLVVRDEGVDPPTVVPLADLDLSVRRFTTRMLREPRSVRFTMDLGAGEVPMPRRVGSHGLVAGLAKAVEGKLAGRQENLTVEPRKLLEEASLSGRLQLVPEPRATLRAGASAVELLGLRGNAREVGVDIGDGLLDVELRARLVGDELDLDTTATLTDLSLSEPKSGPIETYFALPMPLDAVLFLLKDSEDRIRVPVALSASTRGVGGGAIAAAAGRAAVAVVARAVASAPLRVLKVFIDLDTESKGVARGERAFAAFAPGVATLEPGAVAALEPLLARLRSDPALRVVIQHRLSSADVDRMDLLANPSSADVLALQERLRVRRAELQARHERLAADARAGQGAWRTERVAELRAAWLGVVEELGSVEAALDELGELQRPGADRHRANRTRAAALLLGQRRLAELVELLESARPDGSVECEVRAANLQVAQDEDAGAGAVLVVLRRR